MSPEVVAPEGRVVIEGYGFGEDIADVTVTWTSEQETEPGQVMSLRVLSWSDQAITAALPAILESGEAVLSVIRMDGAMSEVPVSIQ